MTHSAANVFENQTLYHLLQRSWALYAGRPACLAGKRSITYGDLGSYAGRIAGAILSGASAETSVTAFLAYRSVEAYACVAGIVMAGQGYVPLHPKFPVDRTKRMLDLCGTDTLLLTREGLDVLAAVLDGFPRRLRIIPIGDIDAAELRQQFPGHFIVETASHERTQEPGRSSVAYVLFTSGSTGLPKGVPITHANVTSYLNYVGGRYSLTPDDRVSQTFDMTFDLSVHDMFLCWASGACLCTPSETAMLAPTHFIRDNRLTVWFSVPSVAMLMLQMKQLKPGALPDLRVSLFCGEALPSTAVESWASAAPNSIIDNLYGPTEATIAISHYRWTEEDATKHFPGGVVPIGDIFPTSRGCIVDDSLHPVPDGDMGELCLAGPQISPGYWNNPEQTAKTFVRVAGNDGIWYRTGDLVRKDETGTLMYLNRIDFQIQIMGHRVELQEVEQTLRKAAGTELAVAVPWPITGNRADMIFAVCVGDPPADSLGILVECRRLLPGYMVPREVLWIDSVPLNANGKIDRHAVARIVEEKYATE